MIAPGSELRCVAALLAGLAMTNPANAAPPPDTPPRPPALRETTEAECSLLTAAVSGKQSRPKFSGGPFLTPLTIDRGGVDAPLSEVRDWVRDAAPTLPDDAVDDFARIISQDQPNPVELTCDFGESGKITTIPRSCNPIGAHAFSCRDIPTDGIKFRLPLTSRRGEDGLVMAVAARTNAEPIAIACHLRKSEDGWIVVACRQMEMAAEPVWK